MDRSSSESIVRAHEIMNEIKKALATNADGTFPPRHAQMVWGGIEVVASERSLATVDAACSEHFHGKSVKRVNNE
jgi:hypothetical protein